MNRFPKDKDGQPILVPAIQLRERPDYITQVREYELITPLFGGGVEPGVADPVTTIRATEIRGHLRFWWRATRGGQFDGDLKKMKEAEDAIFGASSTKEKVAPSQVQLSVEIIAKGTLEFPFDRSNTKWKDIQYAAFPLQDEQQCFRTGVKFKLHINYKKENQADIEAALWAWEIFGGMGGRTRRGFGAIKLLSVQDTQTKSQRQIVMPYPQQFETLLSNNLKQFVMKGVWPDGIPHLSSDFTNYKHTTSGNPLSVWGELIKALKRFRQSRINGSFGRSHWPEPELIKSIYFDQDEPDEKKLTPRAQFGLPIVFHFKKEVDLEEQTHTLVGERHERLASPLILKPVPCANNQYAGLAIILDMPRFPPGGVGLILDPLIGGWVCTEPELTEVQAKSILPLKGNKDVLKAFLASLPSASASNTTGRPANRRR